MQYANTKTINTVVETKKKKKQRIKNYLNSYKRLKNKTFTTII